MRTKALSGASRRTFLTNMGLAGLASQIEPEGASASIEAPVRDLASAIDFRYAPLRQQLTTCFPDDHVKTVVGENSELRLGHRGFPHGDLNDFQTIVEFSVLGMERDAVQSQRIESPGVPIVHTRIDRPDAYIEITVFSSREAEEGRVDNVLIEVRPKAEWSVNAVPLVVVRSRKDYEVEAAAHDCVVSENETASVLFVSDTPVERGPSLAMAQGFQLRHGFASDWKSLHYFLRFPQEGQAKEKLAQGLRDPGRILENVRLFWRSWQPFAGPVECKLPSRYGEFLKACTRNILQAREMKNGRLTFQVGPTVYRGLWIVDGNFLLEAARYLGYDKEAQQGLETEWSQQQPNGAIVAAGGKEHWKDTGIALFTLTRQAELAQDYSYFREMQPNALRAIEFLRKLRDEGMKGESANGRYGILPPGFADGGIWGVHNEFTNTVWVLAGLKAWLDTAARLKLSGIERAQTLYRELRDAFGKAAAAEMTTFPSADFQYLPMISKHDDVWNEADQWERPNPQTVQWALSHSIFPGRVFEPGDPVVQGHIRLMQAVTREDVPIETGWLHHGGLWTYNAAFVAEVYLWAGLADWARVTFHGFLNHASPNYCWREEQPAKGSLTASYFGDMPHNWASAECIRFLRHMLVLEDGQALRLLAGVGDPELAISEPMILRSTPTRFGRVDFEFKPLERNRGWELSFSRENGPAPDSVVLPNALGRKFKLDSVRGASYKSAESRVEVDPAVSKWRAVWKT